MYISLQDEVRDGDTTTLRLGQDYSEQDNYRMPLHPRRHYISSNSFQGHPFAILLLLLEHPGDLVTREHLREQIWDNGTFVDFEHGLNAAMNKLRRALGDSADKPRYIETLSGVVTGSLGFWIARRR